MKILLKKGRILDPSSGLDFVGDLLVEDGNIRGVERDIELSEKNITMLDCQGKLIFPGLVDMHVHLRELERSGRRTLRVAQGQLFMAVFSGLPVCQTLSLLTILLK